MDISTACLYTYLAVITSVYDGDTITANVDLGMNIWLHDERLRLARIDAPEVRGAGKEQGFMSRDWLRGQLIGKKVLITTEKDKKGSFGRYIAEVYLDGVNINERLVEQGFARYKEY